MKEPVTRMAETEENHADDSGKAGTGISRMTEKEIEIDGAGRTDAGVHAKNQTASVHLAKKWDRRRFCNI